MSSWTKFRDNYLGPTVTVLGAATGQEWLAGLGAAYTAERQAKLAQKEQERREDKQHAFDMEILHDNQKFASPTTQAELMREAGYNPYVAGSEGMLNAPSSSMGTSSSLPSSGLPYPNFTETINGSMSALRDLADSVDKLSHADLTKQQKTDLVETAFDRYRKITTEADMSEMDKKIKAIDLDFEQQHGFELRRQKYQKVKNEVDKLYEEWLNAIEQKDLTKAQKEKVKVEKELTEYLRDKTKAERDFAQARADRVQEFLDGELDVLHSQSFNNYSQGNYANTQSAWLPYRSQTERISANASAQEAYTHWQEYNNPRDLQGAILRKIENNPEGAGDVIMDVLENVSSSMLKRLDSSAKKLMLDHLKKDVQDYDSHPDAHSWFNDFIYDGKRRRIEDLEKGFWHR